MQAPLDDSVRATWKASRRAAVLFGLAVLSFTCEASAYSYAAAGKEPLIEAREEIRAALARADFDQARKASETIQEELSYLDELQGLGLRGALETALAGRDPEAVDRVLFEALIAEIRRRLRAAGEEIATYQIAKTLVVKAKIFFDLVAPDLPEAARARADAGLRGCLEAIGNPGIFGVGARPPEPEAFARHRAEVLASLP